MSFPQDVAPSAEEMAHQLEADRVIVHGVEGQDLQIVDIWPPHPAAGGMRLQVGFGVTGVVARTGEPVLLGKDSPRNPVHRTLLGLEKNKTVARMCLPLFGFERRVVGVLAASRDPRHPFGSSDLRAAERFVPTLGLALHADALWRAAGEHQTERERLVKQAISAQEAERRRIAFDLHDGVTTALASLSFHLSAADLTVSELTQPNVWEESRMLLVERARAELAGASDLVDQAYHQTRAAISGLHSLILDDLGLVAALESLTRPEHGGDGPVVDLVVDPSAAIDRLADHAAAAIYRIAQEALSNALKHANATRIVLSLRQVGDSLVFGCADDGCGFDPEERRESSVSDEGAQHFGLRSMAERCAIVDASLKLDSAPGRGTTVLVELPV